jgi:hypothetical protein
LPARVDIQLLSTTCTRGGNSNPYVYSMTYNSLQQLPSWSSHTSTSSPLCLGPLPMDTNCIHASVPNTYLDRRSFICWPATASALTAAGHPQHCHRVVMPTWAPCSSAPTCARIPGAHSSPSLPPPTRLFPALLNTNHRQPAPCPRQPPPGHSIHPARLSHLPTW